LSENLEFENTIQPTTTGCGACLYSTYCFTSGSNNFEFIDSVYFGLNENGSGANSGYATFEDMQATFGPNGSYPIRIVPGYSGFNFTERFLVFIDFDQDGEFNMSEEFLINQSNNGPIDATLNIPSSFTPGLTKMRIVMIGGTALSNPCPSTYYGETEDYCVILDPTASINKLEVTDYSIYPNPATNQVTITSEIENMNYQILSSDGKLIQTISSSGKNTLVSLDHFNKGIYFVQGVKNGQILNVKKLIIQ